MFFSLKVRTFAFVVVEERFLWEDVNSRKKSSFMDSSVREGGGLKSNFM